MITAIIFSFSLPGQEGRGNGRLVGYIIDKEKNPIKGVKLTLEYLSFNYKLTTISDAKGKWTFARLGLGTVKIITEKEGFAKSGIQLKVSGVKKNPIKHIIMKRLSEIQPKKDENTFMRNEFLKANSLFKERKFEEALTLYNDILEKKPQMYKIGSKIANCYLELGRYEKALEEYQKVLEKLKAEDPKLETNKDIAQIFSFIGEAYMRQDKLKEAGEYFKKSIEIDESDHALAYNVAEILFAASKTDEAIKYYNLAIKIKPDWPKSYKQLGYAYLNKGDTKKAIEMLKKFLELAPESPEAPGIKEVIKSL